MGKSYITESRFQIDTRNNRYHIQDITMLELIMLNTCTACLQGLKTLDATCTSITNGIPCITIPTNRVEKNTKTKLEGIRMCRKI